VRSNRSDACRAPEDREDLQAVPGRLQQLRERCRRLLVTLRGQFRGQFRRRLRRPPQRRFRIPPGHRIHQSVQRDQQVRVGDRGTLAAAAPGRRIRPGIGSGVVQFPHCLGHRVRMSPGRGSPGRTCGVQAWLDSPREIRASTRTRTSHGSVNELAADSWRRGGSEVTAARSGRSERHQTYAARTLRGTSNLTQIPASPVGCSFPSQLNRISPDNCPVSPLSEAQFPAPPVFIPSRGCFPGPPGLRLHRNTEVTRWQTWSAS